MKVAYLLLAHKDPGQILRLVNSLGNTGDFFIHIDKKTKATPFYHYLSTCNNVIFTSKRHKVSWAGWSMIKGYMEALQLALNSDENYDRFVLLTGQDYPLMSNKQIIEEFSKHLRTEYVMAYNIVTSTLKTDKDKIIRRWYLDPPFKNAFLQRVYKSIMYRVLTKHFMRSDIQVPLGNKMVDPYFGQMLSAFTKEGAELIMNTYLYDKGYNAIMKHVFAAVEIYWQTIIFNSPLRDNTIQQGEEHEITEHFGWAPLHYHTYVVDTSIFDEKDFEELKACGYMFCRKVVPGISDTLMNLIDEMRGEKSEKYSDCK